MNNLLLQQLKYYKQWDFLLFTCLTLLSVLDGSTTVFYLIYFFWWGEVIRLSVDWLYFPKNPNATILSSQKFNGFESFFLMGIYFVFIIVFFGFIASYKNTEIVSANMRILFFQNWFFNINLFIFLIHRILLHITKQKLSIHFGGFTPNMITLHISIIFGGVLIFFVINKYPEIFTPENLWGSVLIVFPFLILKGVVSKIS